MCKAYSLAVFFLRKSITKRFGDSITLCSCQRVSKSNVSDDLFDRKPSEGGPHGEDFIETE
jgi:hypothetical protein